MLIEWFLNLPPVVFVLVYILTCVTWLGRRLLGSILDAAGPDLWRRIRDFLWRDDQD